MALGAEVVKICRHFQPASSKWQLPIAVQIVRLRLFNQVLDSEKPVFFPGFGNSGFVPVQLASKKLWICVRVIEVRIFWRSAIVKYRSEGAFFVAEMADGKPFVTDPEMVAYTEAQAMFPCGIAEFRHDVPLGPHFYRIPARV